MTASVHPVQGDVQGGVQGRNPHRHWIVQGVQGSALHGRTRTNESTAAACLRADARAHTRTPPHTLHALHNAGVAQVTGVQGGVQGQMHPAHARARTRAIPLSRFPESEGRGAPL